MKPSVRRLLARLALLLAALAISLGITEIALRVILASDFAFAAELRKPQYFADHGWDDTYWLLQDAWAREFRRPKKPHPLLGWAGPIDHATYLHGDAEQLEGRRPVLLYGDSFSETVWQAAAFQDLWNQDPEKSRGHYLLNYGSGGYGLGQILLSLEKSLPNYDDPFVVFGFMTYDLHRSVLSVRIGQKPYFVLAEDELELRGMPIDPDPEHYFSTHPPAVHSYLWRLFLHYWKDLGPARYWLRDEDEKRRYKQALNRKILERAKAALEGSGTRYVFLVFHPRPAFLGNLGWEDSWVRETLDELEVPYIWSVATVGEALPDASLDELFVPENGHPTTLFNQVITDEIARRANAAEAGD